MYSLEPVNVTIQTQSCFSILRISDFKTLELLELYQKEECLWNFNHKEYRKKKKRYEAACRIASALNIPHFNAKHVIMKFKNLRNSYSQELKKIAVNKAKGITYTPSVFWFQKISFIKPYLQTLMKQSITSLESVINKDKDSDISINSKRKDLLKSCIKNKKIKTAKEQSETEDGVSTSTIKDEELVVVENDESDPLMVYFIDKETEDQPGTDLAVEPTQSENEPEILNKKRNIQENPNVNSPKRFRKESESDKRSKIRDKKFKDLYSEDQKTLGSFLEDLSANLYDLINRHNDYCDDFGRYVASLLRSLPQKKALEVQPQIISLITAAGLENLGSQGELQESQLRIVKIEGEIDESDFEN